MGLFPIPIPIPMHKNRMECVCNVCGGLNWVQMVLLNAFKCMRPKGPQKELLKCVGGCRWANARGERESGGWEGGGPSTQARAFKNTHMDGRGEGRGSSSQLPAALATPCICNIEGWINWVPNALGVINLAPCITCNSSLNPSYVWMYPFAFSMLQYVHLCPETPTLTCIWTRWISEMTGCISKLQQNQTPHHFRWI